MLRYSLTLMALVLVGRLVHANDLKLLYELALTRDPTLQVAHFQRDASIEVRPQALASLLPQLSASASATRERAGYDSSQISSTQSAGCTLSADAGTQRCYGTVRGLGLNLSQTLWSYQAFNQLKEANLQAAAAEATFRGAEQNLLLRVAQAYFGILSASDQLATNRSEREAFGTLLSQASVRQQTGVGPRSDVAQAQAFYDATEQSVIDARSALDDANLALTEIVGPRADRIAPLRDDIPLSSPEPASAEEWVATARQENFGVRAAQLKVEAAARDVSAQRGRGLPTLLLTGSSSKLSQNETFGGNQSLDTVGVSFSWPILQGGAVASGVRQSRALCRQAESALDAALRDTEKQTRAAFRNIVSGVQRIAAARRAVASGRDAVEASRRSVEFGTGKEFDLLNAQNNYYVAIRAYNQARYDYLTSVLTLKLEAARLTERDLIAIDDLLVEGS
ncbi:MAG TPA: TolC family outer membrane protein [Steroidobacteraceae bacterium]|nr:TolC family outer membrane protein [Steroidobacteraceae bacterium]